MGVVIVDAVEQREQFRGAGCQQPRVAQPHGRFLGIGVLEFNHFGDPVTGGNDPAIGERIGGFEAEHHDRRRIGGVEPVEHPAHCRRADERHIAVKHQHIARKPGQRAFGLPDRVRRAMLRILHRDVGAAPQRRFELVAPRTDHHHLPRGR